MYETTLYHDTYFNDYIGKISIYSEIPKIEPATK